jgi:hypothetical protein
VLVTCRDMTREAREQRVPGRAIERGDSRERPIEKVGGDSSSY